MKTKTIIGFCILTLLMLSGCKDLASEEVDGTAFTIGDKNFSSSEFVDEYNRLEKEHRELNESYNFLMEDLISTDESLDVISNWYLRKYPELYPKVDIDYDLDITGSFIGIDYPSGVQLDYNEIGCNSNSMRPILNCGNKVFGKKPSSPDDIREGDIISFKPDWNYRSVVHRVVEVKEKNGQTLYVTRQDNSEGSISNKLMVDPEPVPFSDVNFVVVGILYG